MRKSALKMCGTAFAMQSVIGISLMLIIFSGGVYIGNSFMTQYRTDKIISDCDTLDRALARYSKYHRGLNEASVLLDSEGKLVYKKTAVYPKSLSELKLVQSEFGYFSGNINLTDFTYSTSTVSGQMTYELGVVLPNGQYYTSPFSNKHK